MQKYFIYAVILLFTSFKLSAQKFQPVIGIHGGVNFSIPKVTDSYEMITLLNGEPTPDRNYNNLFQSFGHQIGFSLYLYLNDHLAIGLLPQMATYTYGYNTSLEFFNTNGAPVSMVERFSESKLNYINIPLVLNYYIRKATFSPYLMGGASYGIMRGAQQTVETQTTDYATSDVTYPNTTQAVNDNEYIRSKINVFGGVGAQYDLTQLRIALDISYWMGLNNIVNETNRYDTQSLSGRTYAVSDDLTLDHVVVNLSVLFPINKVNTKGALDCTTFKKKRK